MRIIGTGLVGRRIVDAFLGAFAAASMARMTRKTHEFAGKKISKKMSLKGDTETAYIYKNKIKFVIKKIKTYVNLFYLIL